MDRLLAGEFLTSGNRLLSNNGWFGFAVYMDGSFGLYRVQTFASVWNGPPSTPPVTLTMQLDGNLVAVDGSGAVIWNSNTHGNAGAYFFIQDDGEMTVRSPIGNVLWTTHNNLDLQSPTIRYGSPGYNFNETSESWKQFCEAFPCCLALQWPGYATAAFDTEINGLSVVIQLWKGYCPKFLGFTGLQTFPGGIGAEVGVYRRIPGRLRPTNLHLLPQPLAEKLLNALSTLADNEFWWPCPEAGAQLEFSLINPINQANVFDAGPQNSFWLAKWMEDTSYRVYADSQGAPASITSPWYPPNSSIPSNPADYVLRFKINGVTYPDWKYSTSFYTGKALTAHGAISLLLL